MPFDHTRHQKPAEPVNRLRRPVLGDLTRRACNFGNSIAFDENLACIGCVIDRIPYRYIGEQKSRHGFPLWLGPAGVLFAPIAVAQPLYCHVRTLNS